MISTQPLVPPHDVTRRKVALVAASSVAVATWLLMHAYGGIMHDAVIYTLLALARLHPHELSNDVFIRFGSQDSYTLFGPLLARAIALLGLDRAAALLTFVNQAAFFCAAWFLARRFAPPMWATLGVVLLMSLPGYYGAGRHFVLVENFLTPRLAAEALVLVALNVSLRGRWVTACLCLLAAAALHPIMTAAGAVMIVLYFTVFAHPRLTLSIGATLFTLTALAGIAIPSLGHFDSIWLAAVRETSDFLYVSTWSPADWCQNLLPIALLGIGALRGQHPLLRRICLTAIATAASGLLVNYVFCDLLNLILFSDLQAWRWLWVADVIAIVLSPVILADCWRTGPAGRFAVLALIASWTPNNSSSIAVAIAGAALVAAFSGARWRDARVWRLLIAGGWGVLVLALGNELVYRGGSPIGGLDPDVSATWQELQFWCGDGFLPTAMFVIVWLALLRVPSTLFAGAVALGGATTCVALAQLAWPHWSAEHYTTRQYERFAPWRAQIPIGVEVLWLENPVSTWALLERPSYWSPFQVPGAIFSRPKALLVKQRGTHVAQAAGGTHKTSAPDADDPQAPGVVVLNDNGLTHQGLTQLCRDPQLGYVVSWLDLGGSPIPALSVNPDKPAARLHLYRCSALEK